MFSLCIDLLVHITRYMPFRGDVFINFMNSLPAVWEEEGEGDVRVFYPFAIQNRINQSRLTSFVRGGQTGVLISMAFMIDRQVLSIRMYLFKESGFRIRGRTERARNEEWCRFIYYHDLFESTAFHCMCELEDPNGVHYCSCDKSALKLRSDRWHLRNVQDYWLTCPSFMFYFLCSTGGDEPWGNWSEHSSSREKSYLDVLKWLITVYHGDDREIWFAAVSNYSIKTGWSKALDSRGTLLSDWMFSPMWDEHFTVEFIVKCLPFLSQTATTDFFERHRDEEWLNNPDIAYRAWCASGVFLFWFLGPCSRRDPRIVRLTAQNCKTVLLKYIIRYFSWDKVSLIIILRNRPIGLLYVHQKLQYDQELYEAVIEFGMMYPLPVELFEHDHSVPRQLLKMEPRIILQQPVRVVEYLIRWFPFSDELLYEYWQLVTIAHDRKVATVDRMNHRYTKCFLKQCHPDDYEYFWKYFNKKSNVGFPKQSDMEKQQRVHWIRSSHYTRKVLERDRIQEFERVRERFEERLELGRFKRFEQIIVPMIESKRVLDLELHGVRDDFWGDWYVGKRRDQEAESIQDEAEYHREKIREK